MDWAQGCSSTLFFLSFPALYGVVHNVVDFPDLPLLWLAYAAQAQFKNLPGAYSITSEGIQKALDASACGVLGHECLLTVPGFFLQPLRQRQPEISAALYQLIVPLPEKIPDLIQFQVGYLLLYTKKSRNYYGKWW